MPMIWCQICAELIWVNSKIVIIARPDSSNFNILGFLSLHKNSPKSPKKVSATTQDDHHGIVGQFLFTVSDSLTNFITDDVDFVRCKISKMAANRLEIHTCEYFVICYVSTWHGFGYKVFSSTVFI